MPQSEQTQPTPSRAARIQSAWAEAESLPTFTRDAAPQEAEAPAPAPAPKNEDAITKEVLDEKREPVAPSIREFLRAHKPKQEDPEASALKEQVAELTAALNELRAKPEPVDPQTQVLTKLQELEQRERERLEQAQREAQEAQEQERLNTLRSGVISNLERRKEDYPAIFALGQQEGVVNELFARLEADDAEASDFSVASEYEASLVDLYKKLHAVLGSTSEETKPVSESPTLNSTLTGTDTEEDLSGLSRQERIHRAWLKANS